MPITGIILSAPYALCTGTVSNYGVNSLQVSGSDFIFGLVDDVYETCDSVSVGDVLYFDKLKTPTIQYGSSIYYLVNVNNKAFKEEPVP